MSDPTLRVGSIELAITPGGLRRRSQRVPLGRYGPWQSVSLQELRRSHDAPSEVWAWLREHGYRRPSPSGASGRTTPHAEREGRLIQAYINEDASAALDLLVEEHGSIRAALESALCAVRW